MKRVIFILAVMGAVGAVWFAANRFMEHPAGWFRGRASSFAASVRKRGPGFIQDVAYGIEKAGEATESRAETLRERAQSEENQT